MLTYDSAVIDASNLLWRCFISCETSEQTTRISSLTVSKFLARTRHKLLHSTSNILFCFDNPLSGVRKRKALDPAYKSHREHAPSEFFAACETFRASCGAQALYVSGHEADDLLEIALARCRRPAVVISADLDWSRVISHGVHWYDWSRVWTPESFESKYGFAPQHVVIWKSFRGDRSDGIPPGWPRMKSSLLADMLRQNNDLDSCFAWLCARGYQTELMRHRARIDLNYALISASPPENFH